jgi:hypothetical protein
MKVWRNEESESKKEISRERWRGKQKSWKERTVVRELEPKKRKKDRE